jgi:UDP-N-acetylmuramoyl-tripeptide--D-alanyl-D-alanine ligase
VEDLGLFGTKAVIHTGDTTVHAEIPVPGKVMVYNAMAATAAGRLFGLTAEEIEAGIKKIQPVAGRSHLVKTGRYVVIDDCYNASPVSMTAALDLLTTAQGRKVAVLGDMGELGENEIALHERVGRHAAENGIDLILCVGTLSKHMADAACAAGGQVHYFADKEELMARLPHLLMAGDTILVKASHSMQFEKIVNFLING